MKKFLNVLLKSICLLGILVVVLIFVLKFANLENTTENQAVKGENSKTESFKLANRPGEKAPIEVVYEDINGKKVSLENIKDLTEEENKQQKEDIDENIETIVSENIEKTVNSEKEVVQGIVNYKQIELSEENCDYSINENQDTIIVEGYTGHADELIIPEKIDGKEIENIDVECLSKNYNLETIKISKEIADKIYQILK